MAPMEIDLTTVEDETEEEYISAPVTPPTSGNTSTTNISIRIKTPELIIPAGVLIVRIIGVFGNLTLFKRTLS
ncbi:hypothetical protein BDM02DRAFT_3193388 [Thelephora ganbajun]|uniref:Uncharacterized protein n=1 Tax=Thelephora ganbajun TaxID=370292 RepID=A0ACB6YYZ6_THEGA|nr:hypothetical protein BDM02DRAFT_3193388 [Thelephora ganbajun]